MLFKNGFKANILDINCSIYFSSKSADVFLYKNSYMQNKLLKKLLV